MRLKKVLIGRSIDVQDPKVFHNLSLIAFFAWVGLGADGLSSSCYGPEEAFLALGPHISLGIFVAIGSAMTILIIGTSYSHIIELFPSGGGGYIVASKLLSKTFGMISGCSLLIDYILTITISVASGADAIFSFLPQGWYHYRLCVAVIGVIILIWLNLRGVKESVLPLVPIFLIFIITHVFAIIYAISSHMNLMPEIIGHTVQDVSTMKNDVGLFAVIFIILRAYSMGAGTFTGIEAVSNGIPILRDPKVKTAKHTMHYMMYSLSFMVLGLMIAYLLFGVHHVPGKTLNAILFTKLTEAWPAKLGYAFVLVTLISEATLLFVAAQAGFLDGPRILANMALDRWMPARFSSLNDRLVTQNGILIMGVSGIILMLFSGGSVKLLVVLYSINVFITFCLSQLGMVRHWFQVRHSEEKWLKKLMVNGIGLILTTFILCSVVILKFHEGGWITLFITGALVLISIAIHRHYRQTGKILRRLDGLVDAAQIDIENHRKTALGKKIEPDFKAKSAVIFVNGFSGTGLHTLFSVIRMFGGLYKNFIFVQVGVVDSGVFKGSDEIKKLQSEIDSNLDRYVEYMNLCGFYAEKFSSMGIDIVEESVKIAPSILEKFPDALFFAGQIVFPEELPFSRWLHNYSAFAIQRQFYHLGIQIVILPIRV